MFFFLTLAAHFEQLCILNVLTYLGIGFVSFTWMNIKQCQRLANCSFLANGLTAAKARLISLFFNTGL